MQLLRDASSLNATPERCAAEMLETVPQVMQFIRRQMRSLRGQELTVPQIRTLYYLGRHSKRSLSDAAEFIGLSLPAMSRLVDCLVKKGMVTRAACPEDRRHVRLGLTGRGQRALDAAWERTRERLTEEVAALTPEQREVVCGAMSALRGIFDPGHVELVPPSAE